MDINIEVIPQGPGVAIVALAGNLDLTSAPTLKQQLLRTIEDGHPWVVVNLERVPMLDSSGLAALITSLKAARRAGGDLRLARPSAQARYVLELAGLDRILPSAVSDEDAVRRIGLRHHEAIVLSADPAELRKVRAGLARLSVAAQMAMPGSEEMVRTAFATAVIEIASEVLMRAGPPGASGALAIELSIQGENVEATLEAHGDGCEQDSLNERSTSRFDLASRSVDTFAFERVTADAVRWRLSRALSMPEILAAVA